MGMSQIPVMLAGVTRKRTGHAESRISCTVSSRILLIGPFVLYLYGRCEGTDRSFLPGQ